MSIASSPSDLSKNVQKNLILASTSKYRKELLSRLGIDFETLSPEVDESPLPDESPQQIALRLAQEKALIISKKHPESWVIGSDQVVDFHGAAMGKPGDFARAMAQLQLLRGETVQFHTAVCLAKNTEFKVINVITEVKFRELKDSILESYLLAETPYDCAGSAKSEGLGICLLEYVRSDDPTALIGLPLITLSGLLRDAGFKIPG